MPHRWPLSATQEALLRLRWERHSLIVVLESQKEFVMAQDGDLVFLPVRCPASRNKLRLFPVVTQQQFNTFLQE